MFGAAAAQRLLMLWRSAALPRTPAMKTNMSNCRHKATLEHLHLLVLGSETEFKETNKICAKKKCLGNTKYIQKAARNRFHSIAEFLDGEPWVQIPILQLNDYVALNKLPKTLPLRPHVN